MSFSTIRALYDITDNSYGFTGEEIAKEEQRLQSRLPTTLREYYLQLGKHEALNHTQDNLVLPEQLEIHDSGYLVIYTENQFVSMWGINTADLDKEDPPVYITHDDQEWHQESNTLSGFLLAMAYLQGLFAFPFNANKAGVTEEEAARVYDGWKPVGQTLSIWQVSFFQNDLEEIIAVMKSPEQVDVFVAAKTERRLEDISVQLDIDWDCYSPEDGDDWS
ncbi:SMI1/KNR4 family protein [Chitinophaga pendula]|uniref:SMI1/KNR4 family protein n=1 Tax=Chitinophaga TaxID=79328 RepID=UPI0012FD56E2|nr:MULTISPECIES: SMI1/KNR4 family protein [Chitinophaga]UCJ07526.1 SMI1/KNR4 family protein [Chitinophaga pendula]